MATLYAHFKLNDNESNTAVVDTKGASGVLSNAGNTTDVSTTDAIIDRAFEFDGVDDYVDAGLATYAANNGAISVWFKQPSTILTGDRYIVSRRASTPTNGNISVYINGTDSKLHGRIEFTGGGYRDVASDLAITDSGWHHVVINWFGSIGFPDNRMEMWIDGYMHGLTDWDFTFTSSAVKLAIGEKNGTSPTGTESWGGIIDDVRIYNGHLTHGEIGELYNDGAGTESEVFAAEEVSSYAVGAASGSNTSSIESSGLPLSVSNDDNSAVIAIVMSIKNSKDGPDAPNRVWYDSEVEGEVDLEKQQTVEYAWESYWKNNDPISQKLGLIPELVWYPQAVYTIWSVNSGLGNKLPYANSKKIYATWENSQAAVSLWMMSFDNAYQGDYSYLAYWPYIQAMDTEAGYGDVMSQEYTTQDAGWLIIDMLTGWDVDSPITNASVTNVYSGMIPYGTGGLGPASTNWANALFITPAMRTAPVVTSGTFVYTDVAYRLYLTMSFVLPPSATTSLSVSMPINFYHKVTGTYDEPPTETPVPVSFYSKVTPEPIQFYARSTTI